MDRAEAFVAYLEHYIGLPYRWAGDDPMDGFDCSGLVCEGLAAVGYYQQDTTARGLYVLTSDHAVPTDSLRRGDLVFYGPDLDSIRHIGIVWAVLDTGAVLMMEAGGGGSTTVDRAAAVRQNAFVRVRPISRRTDLVAATRPLV
jgi:cell wall-associated NlpC family hydrolase